VDSTRLDRIAGGQDGLFTRQQARACGFSAYQVRQRISAGRWRRIQGWVLAPDGLLITAVIRDRAAQLAVPGSVLAGPAAARRWALPVSDPRTFLLVRPHAHPPRAMAECLYETVDPPDVQIFEGAHLTSRARTVFDCLRLLPRAEAHHLLDWALQQRVVGIDELAERVRGHVGRRGIPQLVALVRTAAQGDRSAAERMLTGLLRRARVPGWQPNVAIHDERGVIGIGDVVFDEIKLVVEADGWAYHTTPDVFQADRRRQNRLVAAGWTVLRFTWRDLTERSEYVVNSVLAMVNRLSRQFR
jgi:very-short-patch-repair endonuclease